MAESLGEVLKRVASRTPSTTYQPEPTDTTDPGA